MDKEKILNKAPDVCGIYIMKDRRGEILYVGKARSLKKRISSYFQRPQSEKTINLISQVEDIEFIPTKSEAEALLLETNLIKEKKPKYNISYRDDKSFPWIKITDEEFPAIYICRPRTFEKVQVRSKEKKDGFYFGPYTNAKLLRSALKDIRRIFGFRSCRRLPRSPCLYFRLNLCPAPCRGNISKRKYRRLIRDIILFLEGRHKELSDLYFKKMTWLSERKNFEEAAKIRDRIKALSSIFVSTGELEVLRRRINLPKLPYRIEAFDISSIKGEEKTGSMVSFYMGRPDKTNYRHFRIKGVVGIDDYKCLEEVLRRRYRRVIKEKLILPDLIIIDGGKGHLSCAKRVLEELNLKIPILAIAKPRPSAQGRGKEKEEIFLSTRDKPLGITLDSESLHLIQHIRDEAHRFAIKYHHILRRKKIIGK